MDSKWINRWYELLPDLLLALAIFLLAIWLSRILKKAVFTLTQRKATQPSTSMLLGRLAQIIVLGIGLFVALDILQWNKAVASLLAGAGVAGIILGFALQDITSNFVAGVYIALNKPFQLGHTIKTHDFMGHVEQISLRSTIIRTFSGLHLMIPNRDIIQKPLINYSQTLIRRIELDFFIDPQSDLEKVTKAMWEAMEPLKELCPEKEIEIYINDFKDNAVKIVVWYWIYNHLPPGYMVARHEALNRILQALKKVNVSLLVPVPLQATPQA